MNHFLIVEQPQKELQKMIEYFFFKFEKAFPVKSMILKMKVKYFNGKKPFDSKT